MTRIREDAWWCTYCGHNKEGLCEMDVPYYGTSLQCDHWQEDGQPVITTDGWSPKRRMAQIIKHTMVDTI